MIRLVLGEPQRAQIERDARAAFPAECCGLIEGICEEGLVRATAVRATRNRSSEVDRFEIDPSEHIRLLRAARAAGREIVGCYHSHPNGRAEPSQHDRDNANEKGFIWLIAALSAPDSPMSLRAFVVSNSDFEPIALG